MKLKNPLVSEVLDPLRLMDNRDRLALQAPTTNEGKSA